MGSREKRKAKGVEYWIKRCDQAEHIQEMYEGHCQSLLQCLDTVDGEIVIIDQPKMRQQLGRIMGHKMKVPPRLDIEPYPYLPTQLNPYHKE